jgi:hypothetical protein
VIIKLYQMKNNEMNIAVETAGKAYQTPDLVDLNKITESFAGPCTNGSGNSAMCNPGSLAGTSCDAGSGAA